MTLPLPMTLLRVRYDDDDRTGRAPSARGAVVHRRRVIVEPRTRKIIQIIDQSRTDVHSSVVPPSTTASSAGMAAEHSWGLAFPRWR
jgi:hypothetical protein